MSAIQHLPDDLKKSFGFKLAVYILPGIMFLLVSILIIVPAPKAKEGFLQGHISADTTASSTLVFQPLNQGISAREYRLIPGSDYQLNLPVGQYQVLLKDDNYTSPQLPRTLTVTANSSAIFDITIE